jgi:prepilin-type processing-associated H-X9-DG protein
VFGQHVNPALSIPLKLWQCASDTRAALVGEGVNDVGKVVKVAFTGYLGVSGINARGAQDGWGILYHRSQVRIGDISDGTSNTLMVGERPPSIDFDYGWWFAGDGADDRGTGDCCLGARDTSYAQTLKNFYHCSDLKYGLQPGKVTDNCDQGHFWSLHSGGVNFLLADGSVRFVAYSFDSILPELCTRARGEVLPNW